MKRISQRKDTSLEFRAEKSALSRAVSVGLRAGGTAVLLSMSSQVLSQFGAVVELSDLDGSDGFVINGIDPGDFSGSSVSGAGDINGDGVDDLIIGADGADPNGGSSGEGYVVFGGSSVGVGGIFELSSLDGSAGFVINGVSPFDFSGQSVSGAGDINGDSVADLIIGASTADNNGNAAGESYVVFGGSVVGNSGDLELSALDGSDGFVINGIGGYDYTGVSVSGAGDVNGDGIGDVVIGAMTPFGFDGGYDNSGRGETYVVFGGVSVGGTGQFELSALDGSDGFAIPGIDAYDYSGGSVSSAGDVNGDGVADLIIGAPIADPNGNFSAGESYVLFGGSGVGSGGTIELSDLDGNDGFVINGIDMSDSSGRSVSSAGDINGDGVADLIIGAASADPNGNNSAGESYVLFGGSGVGSGGTFELSDLDGSDGFVINGIDGSDNSGISVSGAGDINEDGVADLIIGARLADPNTNLNAGESYVLFGQAPISVQQCNGLTVTVDLNLGQTPGPGDDVILGTPTADIINGLAGNDTICGEGGDDIINAGTGNDWVDGGPGNDVIRGNGGDDTIFGDLGNDEIRGGGGVDDISGEEGDDTLLGQGGNDTIAGGDGVDGINGGGGRDTLFTGSGATAGTGVFVFGGSGLDTITGGPDADDLRGGNGNDIINGFGGNDVIAGGLGLDTIDGGDGADDISGGNARDTLSGGPGNDVIDGGSQSDIINGGGGSDTLTGGAGDDELNGDSGADTLSGGAGDDDLDGGASAGDVCNGNLGTADTATADCEVINSVP